MRIVIFSDSHGNIEGLENAISYYSPDLVYGLGDYGVNEYELDYLNVFGVRGNAYSDPDYPIDRIFKLKGFNILLTHGHEHGVRYDLSSIFDFAKKNQINIAFYGHTHMANIEMLKDIYFINPGSITLPYSPSFPTLAYMEIEESKARIDIVDASTFEIYKSVTIDK